MRIGINLKRSLALFHGLAPLWLPKSLGRRLLWQSPMLSSASRSRSPALRIRVNLSKAPEWFLGAAISRVSKSLGRCSLWQSPLLSSAPRSRSVWSAAVDRRFPRTVLRAFPFKSGAEAHALQALRATEHAHAQAASAQGPHLSRPKVDAYAHCGRVRRLTAAFRRRWSVTSHAKRC